MENPQNTPEQVIIRISAELIISPEEAEDKTREVIKALGGLGIEATEIKVALNPEEKLDKSNEPTVYVEELLDFEDSPLKTRTLHVLKREGVRTLRDVMVVGREQIGFFRYLGDKSLDLIDEALHRRLGDEVIWQDNPGIRLAAQYFSSPDDVPLAALQDYFALSSTACMTVGEVLSLEEGELAERLVSYYGGPYQPQPKKAKEAKSVAQAFADRFRSARAELTGENNQDLL